MINCAKLAMQFDALLPGAAVPEHTCGRQGFFMLMRMETQVDTGKMNYIIRDHDKELFEAKKAFFLQAGQTLNEIYGREVCEVSVKDQYYNMYDVIKDNMECVNVAKAAMEKAGITPICDPIRGGTDGSKISFMGIPTPNIFTGVENLHGRHEFACIDDMKKAVEVIVNIVNIEK
jgi:tripeptide aminopeptidase